MVSNNGKNGFHAYETECDKVWVYQLNNTFLDINREVYKHTNKELKTPNFHINPSINHKWGSWSPSDRVMTFAASLLRNYEWGAVEHVMRHEVAHQIVSEIFDMDCYGVSHGEAWQEACKIVNIEPVRCDASDFLAKFNGSSESPMVSKVRKLLIHANDEGATEQEAESFMLKAQELMLRNNLALEQVIGTKRVWVKRPFGLTYERWPSWMWGLGDLLSEHYNVKSIRSYARFNYKTVDRLELFGEPDNLDIAEYVGHALLAQAELAYDRFRSDVHAKKTAQRKLDKSNGEFDNYWNKSRISKTAFMKGLFAGYSNKLKAERSKAVSKIQAEDNSIVPAYNKKLMVEMYGIAYPNMRNITGSSSMGAGYGEGRAAGASLTLAKGVNRGSQSRLLNA